MEVNVETRAGNQSLLKVPPGKHKQEHQIPPFTIPNCPTDAEDMQDHAHNPVKQPHWPSTSYKVAECASKLHLLLL